MVKCQNCGNFNSAESNFCRSCGTKFVISQPAPQQGYDYSPPRPYVWKTDEFQTQNEPRKTGTVPHNQPTNPFPNHNYQAQPLVYRQPNPLEQQPYLCPNCMNRFPPRFERRISTTGWIVFAVLLV